MRILYVTNEWLGKPGGGVTHFKEIAHELTQAGHELYVLAPGYHRNRPKDWSVPIILIPLPGRNFFSFALFEALLGFCLAVCLVVLRIDVVLNRGTVSSTLLYYVCRLLRRRYVLEVNGVSDIEVKSMTVRRFGVRLCGWIFRRVYRSADFFICVSSGIREELISRWPSFAGRSTVINNGANEKMIVPLDRLSCRRKLGLPEDKFIVGFVGQLSLWHGVEDLLRVTRLLATRGSSNLVTVIVGGGERLDILKRQATELEITDYVVFAGEVARDQAPVYIGAFDIAAQPHNDPVIGQLGDPLKFWEYLASGRPILLSDMSSSRRYVKTGLIGWLFRGGNIEDMAAQLEYITDHRQECEVIGQANRRFFEQGHTWRDVARRVEQVLLGKNVLDGEVDV